MSLFSSANVLPRLYFLCVDELVHGCYVFSVCRAAIEAPLTLPLSISIAEEDLWSMENVGLFLQHIAEQHAEASELLLQQY